MYNWIIINALGFITGILSSLTINLMCKSFYPLIYEYYYGTYIAIQVLFGCFMGHTVCQWYWEERERYYRLRHSNIPAVQRYYYYNYNPLHQQNRSECIKKINETHMD